MHPTFLCAQHHSFLSSAHHCSQCCHPALQSNKSEASGITIKSVVVPVVAVAVLVYVEVRVVKGAGVQGGMGVQVVLLLVLVVLVLLLLFDVEVVAMEVLEVDAVSTEAEAFLIECCRSACCFSAEPADEPTTCSRVPFDVLLRALLTCDPLDVGADSLESVEDLLTALFASPEVLFLASFA